MARATVWERDILSLPSVAFCFTETRCTNVLKMEVCMVVDEQVAASLNDWLLLGMRAAALLIFWQVAQALKAYAKANRELSPLEKLVSRIDQHIGSVEPGARLRGTERREDEIVSGRVN